MGLPALPEPDHDALLADVETKAWALVNAIKAAEAAGVSPARLMPALVTVLRDAGMLPESFGLRDLLSVLRG